MKPKHMELWRAKDACKQGMDAIQTDNNMGHGKPYNRRDYALFTALQAIQSLARALEEHMEKAGDYDEGEGP